MHKSVRAKKMRELVESARERAAAVRRFDEMAKLCIPYAVGSLAHKMASTPCADPSVVYNEWKAESAVAVDELVAARKRTNKRGPYDLCLAWLTGKTKKETRGDGE